MRLDNGVYLQTHRWLLIQECTCWVEHFFSCTIVTKSWIEPRPLYLLLILLPSQHENSLLLNKQWHCSCIIFEVFIYNARKWSGQMNPSKDFYGSIKRIHYFRKLISMNSSLALGLFCLMFPKTNIHFCENCTIWEVMLHFW